MNFLWSENEPFAPPYTALNPCQATYSVLSGLELFLLVAKSLLEGEYIREGFSEKNIRVKGKFRS